MIKKKPEPSPMPNISGAKRLPSDLGLDRIPFNAIVDNRMRNLKSKTGITPNVLARLGFCLSLEEPGIPANPFQDEAVGREINRTTLLGQHDLIYVCLMRSWVADNASGKHISQKEFDDLFIAHMNRGFEIISSRIRSLADLQNIVPKS